MSASWDQTAPRPEPLPARERYGIATASSVGVHLVILILIGLAAARAPARLDLFIPIEVMLTAEPSPQLDLGLGGRPEAQPTVAPVAPTPAETPKRPPSSPGGREAAAPAPPRVLTSKQGADPAGPQGAGKEPAGPGGQQEAPAGPTRGPGIIGGPAPVYPKDALDRGLTGEVTLAVEVAADGSVSAVTVAKSSGHELLDQAAVRAVKRAWEFEAGLKAGRPAPGTVTLTFEFTSGTVHRR